MRVFLLFLASTPRRLKYPGDSGFPCPQTNPTPAAGGYLSYQDWQVLACGSESEGQQHMHENGDMGRAPTSASATEGWAIPGSTECQGEG